MEFHWFLVILKGNFVEANMVTLLQNRVPKVTGFEHMSNSKIDQPSKQNKKHTLCSYGHLFVITGYFYGIIHSINGVITGKWP